MNRFPTPVLTGSGSKSIISAAYIGTSNGQIKTKRFICKQIHFYIKSVIYLIKKEIIWKYLYAAVILGKFIE